MLEPLLRPFEFRYVDAPPFHQYLVNISVDFDLDWLVSVSTVMHDKGGGRFELSYGIQIDDESLDRSWIEFERTRAKGAYHPDAKPYVLRLAHASARKLIRKIQPDVVFSRTAEPTPLDHIPERFQMTRRLLERCGYDLTFSYQRPDRRWEWTHERRP